MENRRRVHKKKFERPVGTKRPEKTFLILCEGTKTEPNYFRSFHVISAQVEVVGTAMNTMSLVNYARDVVDTRPDEYDEIWLVFDKDSFDRDIFNEAVFFCETHYRQGFRAAYSNEAFEIWYLLHFELIKKSISRFHYPDMLSKRLGFFYKKIIRTCTTYYYQGSLLPFRMPRKSTASARLRLPGTTRPRPFSCWWRSSTSICENNFKIFKNKKSWCETLRIIPV
ncbi:RloB family protein [Trichococcus collinsii]|uniref:RloB-like protein n=1 Tax=Trichococcus collinsii TaxID=157076 RepID=A0AB38A263_9LACT|nr:RloB family protein [Trichococcus collinsii]CZQ92341.1 Hypothetical protein Tcol_1198 [Trichococcus collinsii]SEA57731.1 RloB-like protein [Trichococcus collinsii]